MSSQDLDVMYVQNPALGAVLLWRFTCGYYSNENRPAPFPLLFVVLPIVFRQDLCSVIKSTQKASGLSKVSEKLFSGKLNDITLHRLPSGGSGGSGVGVAVADSMKPPIFSAAPLCISLVMCV